MKVLKILFEILAWMGIYSPMYFLFKHLDFLSRNEWGVRYNDRMMQLTPVILIVLLSSCVIFFIAQLLFYKDELLKKDSDTVDVVRRGRGVFRKLFNGNYKTYLDSGNFYLISGATIWCDMDGTEIGKISWIDTECKKRKMREKANKLKLNKGIK